MRRPVDDAGLELLRAAVSKRLGLHLEGANPAVLASLAQERVQATGAPSLAAYARRIEAGELAGELRLLAERLTVGETYFFRNEHDLRAFTDLAVPELRAARAAGRRLRILSAGCATGEEPYTLAMLVVGASELAGWDVRIRAVDVSPAAIERARRGRYGAWSLRQTPDEARARFFVADGREHVVAPEVASLVEFEERNLVDDDPALWTPGGYDVVFCRNVTMYFPPHVARAVLTRIAASLVPGGFLFLGHAETLFGLSTDFDVRETRGAFIYQRRGGALVAPLAPAGDLAPTGAGPGWLEAIHAASERVGALVARHEAAPATAAR
ncbi:MAG TPA: protein-glutamate O-methyltransferase CheR, partial [Anaeromyxobacteraceae bacterium]|nr:protein-glutamate O-methyltransferase CheR [Anaeromyxobacteraceae bacterium]